jgi:hypothetical protein
MITDHHLRFAGSVAALACVAAFALAITPPAQAADKDGAASASKVARGKYLVSTSGCHDCHTPFKMGANGPEPDMSRMLSGHPESLQMPPVPALPQGPWMVVSAATNTAWAGPWGVSFTANLTPDAETGLGQWSVNDFKNTIRTGRHLGRGRAVLPPMPIPVYNNFTDRDLEAIYAYLRTVPALKNRVPEPWAPTPAAAPK